MEEQELTRGQESEVLLLDKIDKKEDDKQIHSLAEAYKWIKEGDAKESEQAREWTRMYMEDEREKAKLRIEEKKVDNDYKVKHAEVINTRVDKICDTAKSVAVGATMVGISKVAVDAVMDCERDGILITNLFSKEVIGKVVKTPIEWVMKLIFH